MISFEKFILEDGIPIYMQIMRHIKQGIVSGSIQNGDEMPSRRTLSVLLGVNPNTVQKAYHLLEEENIIASHSGAISYIILEEAKVETLRRQLLENDVSAIINNMKKTGISKEEALLLISTLWE